MKKVNKKIILYSIAILCCIMIFGFFALPAYTESLLGLTVSTSGYENLQFVLQNMELMSLMEKLAAIAGLVTLILAGLTLVGAVLLLLCELGVIKNEMIAKGTATVTRFISSLLLLASIGQVAFNIMAVKISPDTVDGGLEPVLQPTASPGWAMIFIIAILAVIICEMIVYAIKPEDKQAKQENQTKVENQPKTETAKVEQQENKPAEDVKVETQENSNENK